MRLILLFFIILLSGHTLVAQEKNFPLDWQGNWKGELLWYQGSASEPKKVGMQLNINKIDSSYSWHLTYDNGAKDSRPYRLIPKDIAKGHWQIDENNGIIIDMYFVGNRLTGAFAVGTSTIVTSYMLEGNNLIAEFHNITTSPVSTTGKNTSESPEVKSYGVRSYQRAILINK